jgi:hypothetical protein
VCLSLSLSVGFIVTYILDADDGILFGFLRHLVFCGLL